MSNDQELSTNIAPAGLTPKQWKFLEYYLTGNSAPKSLVLAGYKYKDPDKHTHKFLGHPKIKAFIDKQKDRAVKKFEITYDWKIGKLKAAIDMAIPDDVDVYAEDFKGKYMLLDLRTGIAAISELNKMQGHYAPVKQETVNLNMNADVMRIYKMAEKLKEKCYREY